MTPLSQYVLNLCALRRGLRLVKVREEPEPVTLFVTVLLNGDDTPTDRRIALMTEDVNRGRKPGTEIVVELTKDPNPELRDWPRRG